MTELTPREKLIVRFFHNRVEAHDILFAHRRPQKSPPFHVEMINDWHSKTPRVLDMVFRGGAKSTIAEEAATLQVCFREFKNGIFVGANLDRAKERLAVVRHEVETNEFIRKLFGDLVGPTWSDEELVFSNGRRIIALGRGQSLRGTKFEDLRPDLIFADDLEDREEAWTKAGRAKCFNWFTRDLVPSGDISLRVRVAATPLDPEALPMRLKKDRNWITHTYPIMFKNETGEWESSWPERYPINTVLELRNSFTRMGDIAGFNAEYMCMAESPESKPFRREQMRVEPQIKTWQATYSMTDPARTTGPQAATTGHVVWSWFGPRLIVWDAWARRIMPDEIIDELFKTYEEHHPVLMGFEEDGLNQWALQPIRDAQRKRNIMLPMKAEKAPPRKFDFIRGLRPYFNAREVIFAKPLPDLEDQLLGFPSGDIDAPNALAYALKLRPGAPIYDGFRGSHVSQDLFVAQGRAVRLCLNATPSLLTAVVVQTFDGALRVFADYVREGDPATTLAGLVADAQTDFGRDLKLYAGPRHFERYNNVGLVQAAMRLPRQTENGADCAYGRAWLESSLGREKGGLPAVMVSERATWTLNAFAGGYARVLLKQGVLADYAEEGIYRTLMEGLESYCGLMDLGLEESGSHARFNDVTDTGRPYLSLIGRNAEPLPSKADWGKILKDGS